jgi:hypothetical protein
VRGPAGARKPNAVKFTVLQAPDEQHSQLTGGLGRVPRMAVVQQDTAEELRSELSNLIVRRLRIGLRAFLAGVVLFVVADHSLMTVTPRWADVLNAVLIALAAIFLALSGRPVFRTHAAIRPVDRRDDLLVARACRHLDG